VFIRMVRYGLNGCLRDPTRFQRSMPLILFFALDLFNLFFMLLLIY